MTSSDWVTLAGAAIIGIGWFVTGYLNRRQDIAKTRLEYRLKTFESFLPIGVALYKGNIQATSAEFAKQLEDSQVMFHLYGYKNENEAMSKFVEHLSQGNQNEASKSFSKLMGLIQQQIKSELRING